MVFRSLIDILFLCSHDAFGQAALLGQDDTRDGQQASGGAAAEGGPAGRRLDTRLFAESAASLQEAGQQELPEHLSAVGHTASEQHSVSVIVIIIYIYIRYRNFICVPTCSN